MSILPVDFEQVIESGSGEVVVGELGDLELDALAAEDLHDLPAPALLERTAELVKTRNRLDAELARTVRRAELAQAPEHDGLKSMASWLRGLLPARRPRRLPDRPRRAHAGTTPRGGGRRSPPD